MTAHIGIVGCSAEGAALCYRTICEEGEGLLGAYAHPQVTMHTHSLADYVACLDNGDLHGVARLMQDSAERLARAGADVLICPDNTIHQALPFVDPPLPWLHIVDAVADAAAARGFRRLGLTGTRSLVDSDLYPARLAPRGIEVLKPAPQDRAMIDRIIMEELVRGVFRDPSRTDLAGVIGRLAEAGAKAVILGCTELPLLIDDAASPLPVLDSTRLLARAALAQATDSIEAAE